MERRTFLPNSSRSSGLPRDCSTSLRWLNTHPVWKESDVLQVASLRNQHYGIWAQMELSVATGL